MGRKLYSPVVVPGCTTWHVKLCDGSLKKFVTQAAALACEARSCGDFCRGVKAHDLDRHEPEPLTSSGEEEKPAKTFVVDLINGAVASMPRTRV